MNLTPTDKYRGGMLQSNKCPYPCRQLFNSSYTIVNFRALDSNSG